MSHAFPSIEVINAAASCATGPVHVSAFLVQAFAQVADSTLAQPVAAPAAPAAPAGIHARADIAKCHGAGLAYCCNCMRNLAPAAPRQHWTGPAVDGGACALRASIEVYGGLYGVTPGGGEAVNYYSHHIGDFDRATRHLSRIERSIYRDLLDIYYDTEQPLTLDMPMLCRKIIARTNEEVTAVEQTLNEFFTKTPTGWYHERCEEELEAYRSSTSQKSLAGKASAVKRALKKQEALNGISTDVATPVEQPSNGTPTNQEPITNNHISSTASSSGDDIRQCPTGSLVNLYHELMPLNPQAKVINPARKSAIRARWLEAAKLDTEPFGYATKSAGLEAWRQFFIVCSQSKFLTGMAPATPGKPAFVADIDFLFSPGGFAKTLENKYHRDAT